jgi:hypothetical protein
MEKPMITPLHNKDGFFKYYAAESAKLTLANTSRKWSTPRLFNDPFDNQFNLYYEEPAEELAEQQLRQFHEILTSPEPLKPNQFGPLTPKVELIRQVRLQNPHLKRHPLPQHAFSFAIDSRNVIREDGEKLDAAGQR